MFQEYYVNRMLVVGVPRMQENIWLQLPSVFPTHSPTILISAGLSEGVRESLMLSSSAYHDEEVTSQHMFSHMYIPLFWVKI